MQGHSDDLWSRVASRIETQRGWMLRPLAELGRARDGRRTWFADGDTGVVVVKARANPIAAERMPWVAEALDALRRRGYPVPRLLWQGHVNQRWSACVMERMPGEPLRMLDDQALDGLLSLIDLQGATGLSAGGWDVSAWIGVVLFDGWEGWRDASLAAAPDTTGRLLAFLGPASGYRLPTNDIVHHDMNVTNVLVHDGRISGVVDWDDMGLGSRAIDLAGLLFDWQRLQLTGRPGLAQSGGQRLVDRIVELVGGEGMRCSLSYGAVARLGLAAQRGEIEDLTMWRRVTEALLDWIG